MVSDPGVGGFPGKHFGGLEGRSPPISDKSPSLRLFKPPPSQKLQRSCTIEGTTGIAIVLRAVAGRSTRRPLVQELVRYLLENLYLDFQGDISVEQGARVSARGR